MLGIMGGIVLVTGGDGAEPGKTNGAGAVLGETNNGIELSELKVWGVEASKKLDKLSEFVSSEHIVQLDNMRWYLLFS